MRKIINHEIGHCIGLEENPYDNGTIMYPYWNTCTAYCPTLDDITGVRAKYKLFSLSSTEGSYNI